MFSPKDAIIGGDVSGTIVSVGSNPKQDLKVGDRVAGIVHGNLYPDQGTFATYTKAQTEVIFKVPDSTPSEEAATFGVAWVTALQALVQSQNGPWPPSKVEGEPWVGHSFSRLFLPFTLEMSFIFSLPSVQGTEQ